MCVGSAVILLLDLITCHNMPRYMPGTLLDNQTTHKYRLGLQYTPPQDMLLLTTACFARPVTDHSELVANG